MQMQEQQHTQHKLLLLVGRHTSKIKRLLRLLRD
jgi:hypothetical protein